MPEKITNISNVSVSVLYIVGGLFSLFSLIGVIVSSYAFFIVKTLLSKINDIKGNVSDENDEIKEMIKHDRTMHDEHYDFEKITGRDISEIKTDLKNIKENHEKLYNEVNK